MKIIADTGINLSQLKNLEMNDYRVDESRREIEFYAVKPRAKYQRKNYLVGPLLYEDFFRMLELRDLLMHVAEENKEYPLFVRISKGKPIPLRMDFSTTLNSKLDKLFNFKTDITATDWRVYKSNSVADIHGPLKAASVMGHAEETFHSNYAGVSDSKYKKEIGDFLLGYKSLLIEENRENTVEIGLGGCLTPNDPNAISAKFGIIPQCGDDGGCLFCVHYRVHPDRDDISKLYSYLFLLNEIKSKFLDVDEYYNEHKIIRERIHAILNQLKTSKLVDRQVFKQVEQEVMGQEILHPFWSRKLEMFVDLEVL